jgi:hypothetical protein
MRPWDTLAGDARVVLAQQTVTDYYGDRGQYLGSSLQTENRIDFYGARGEYRGQAIQQGAEGE